MNPHMQALIDLMQQSMEDDTARTQAFEHLKKLQDLLRRQEFKLDHAFRENQSLNNLLGKVSEDFEQQMDEVKKKSNDLAQALAELNQKTTELEEKNRRLTTAQQLAEQAAQAKSEFLANMSHEIRTPLNGIIGMASILADTRLTEEQQEFVETLHHSGESLLGIINDILDFSKIEAGKVTLEEHPFAVRTCVEESLDLVSKSAAEKGVELLYFVEDDVPQTVVGDALRVRQIVVNLLSNAVKFTSEGEVVVRVRTQPETDGAEDNSRLHFSVRDTGIGIPAEKIDNLFQSFSQVDASTTRRYGGTGLGLAISKQLVEAMDGSIHVESEAGVGSTFSFTIRLQKAPQESATRSPLARLGASSVFVVDDNATSRQILQHWTTRWGLHITEAASGQKALRLSDNPFDVALIDMHMPGMDGLTVALRLREQHPTLPLVLLNSLHRPVDAPPGLFAATINKPIKQATLHRTLQNVLPSPTPDAVASSKKKGQAGDVPNTTVPSLPTAAQCRVLVAEDNRVNQRLIRFLLEQMGYRTDLVNNGMEAVQAMQQQSYDLILMDLHMPEMSGLEATRQIVQERPNEERPRILAFTADVRKEVQQECQKAGMDGFLAKPVKKTDLVEALKQVGLDQPLRQPVAEPSLS